jgi:S-adenosylmethionine:tRNA ribosyltransferase-isomerase
MKTSDFYYDLPERLIAQTPMEPRDAARMMVIHTDTGLREDKIFRDLPDYLRPGDVMVINQTKVIPARLLGEKEETGVPVEVLLLKRIDKDTWETLVRPGRRLKKGVTVSFGGGILRALIGDTTDAGAASLHSFMTACLKSCWTGWAKCPCRPTFTKSWKTPPSTRPFTPSRRAAPPPPQPGCTSPRK